MTIQEKISHKKHGLYNRFCELEKSDKITWKLLKEKTGVSSSNFHATCLQNINPKTYIILDTYFNNLELSKEEILVKAEEQIQAISDYLKQELGNTHSMTYLSRELKISRSQLYNIRRDEYKKLSFINMHKIFEFIENKAIDQ